MKNSIPVLPKKKNFWSGSFDKIETKDEALKIIKNTSNGFYFLAVLNIILGYFIVGISAIIDGVILAIMAFLLRKFNSKIAAIILLLLSIVGLIVTVTNKISGSTGGQNLVLAVIMIWLSIRAIQATFGLRKLQ